MPWVNDSHRLSLGAGCIVQLPRSLRSRRPTRCWKNCFVPDPLGDRVETFTTVNGLLLKSIDGGATFLPPVPVVDASAGTRASIIYDVRVDPVNSQILLVGTDTGVFRSRDAGATFTLVLLPNPGPTQVSKAVHSIAFVGAAGGISRWVVSGVYACDAGLTAPAYSGVASSAACPEGNLGDLWRSRDAGKTWTSMRASKTFPGWDQATDAVRGLGRMALGTAATAQSNPGSSVVYALAMAINGHRSVDLLRSDDGGQIWISAKGTVSNPTARCADIGVAERRTGAIAVDPSDDGHVLIGGTDCALRTQNGRDVSPTWDNVVGEEVACGTLPFVHEDWRAALLVRSGTGVHAYSGNDGGLYRSTNLFSVPQGNECTVDWTDLNQGRSTQLVLTLASGESNDGSSDVVLAGLHDNGTFLRDGAGVWNHVAGGDGSGTAVSGSVLWAAMNGRSRFCDLAVSDCRIGQQWTASALPLPQCTPNVDCVPLEGLRYSSLFSDADHRVLAISKFNV